MRKIKQTIWNLQTFSNTICMLWSVKISPHQGNFSASSQHDKDHAALLLAPVPVYWKQMQNQFKPQWGVDVKRKTFCTQNVHQWQWFSHRYHLIGQYQHHLDWAATCSKQLQACLSPHSCRGPNRALMGPWLSQKRSFDGQRATRLPNWTPSKAI